MNSAQQLRLNLAPLAANPLDELKTRVFDTICGGSENVRHLIDLLRKDLIIVENMLDEADEQQNIFTNRNDFD